MDSNYSRLAATACGLALVYAVSLVIQRLYFSPIAYIPGPKLAAATFWYSHLTYHYNQRSLTVPPRVEFYYDCIQRGQYFAKIREWHKIYGPIMCINPEEVHVIDPEFLDEIFPGPTRKRDKWWRHTKALGIEQSIISTTPHDLHRLRRSAINPFFSKASIASIRPVLDGKVQQFMSRLEEFQQTGAVITLNIAYAALTNGEFIL